MVEFEDDPYNGPRSEPSTIRPPAPIDAPHPELLDSETELEDTIDRELEYMGLSECLLESIEDEVA